MRQTPPRREIFSDASSSIINTSLTFHDRRKNIASISGSISSGDNGDNRQSPFVRSRWRETLTRGGRIGIVRRISFPFSLGSSLARAFERRNAYRSPCKRIAISYSRSPNTKRIDFSSTLICVQRVRTRRFSRVYGHFRTQARSVRSCVQAPRNRQGAIDLGGKRDTRIENGAKRLY